MSGGTRRVIIPPSEFLGAFALTANFPSSVGNEDKMLYLNVDDGNSLKGFYKSAGVSGWIYQDTNRINYVKTVTASRNLHNNLATPSDINSYLKCNSVSNIILTIPNSSSDAFPIPTEILFQRDNTGGVTFASSGGVTINSMGGLLAISPGGKASLIHVANNVWDLSGDLI